MKTIITGSGGFIGGHLMKRIEARALKNSDIRYGHSYNVDRFFFLGTYGNMAYHTNHEEVVKANVRDVITVLNGFKGWFCYMSSSSVMLPVQTPYSRTKRAAEEILQALPELKSCIVRPYSVTGVGEQNEHLIPTLIRSCMEGEEMMFDPSPVHDFVDVDDVVDGLIQLSDRTGIYELGSGIPTTNEEVAYLVQLSTGREANFKITKNLRPYDNKDWFCRKPAKGWRPKKTLLQSIREMIEVYGTK